MLNGENLIQQNCVMWFNNNYCLSHHEPRFIIFSVPNESENGWEAQKKVNIGLMKGASDLIVVLDERVLFMECKTPIGVQSDAQESFQHRVQNLGFSYHVFRSLEEFKSIINRYL